MAFQSTLPARGATPLDFPVRWRIGISIHAPRTGSDGGDDRPGRRELHFNPRSPHGERRCPKCRSMSPIKISIHAPRTGSDEDAVSGGAERPDFNPRSPHGERRSRESVAQRVGVFQSTLPARGATRNGDIAAKVYAFQSTLPARGATAVERFYALSPAFQSTLPARGATNRNAPKSF